MENLVIEFMGTKYTDVEEALAALPEKKPAILMFSLGEPDEKNANTAKYLLETFDTKLRELSATGNISYDVFWHPNQVTPRGFDIFGVKYDI